MSPLKSKDVIKSNPPILKSESVYRPPLPLASSPKRYSKLNGTSLILF